MSSPFIHVLLIVHFSETSFAATIPLIARQASAAGADGQSHTLSTEALLTLIGLFVAVLGIAIALMQIWPSLKLRWGLCRSRPSYTRSRSQPRSTMKLSCVIIESLAFGRNVSSFEKAPACCKHCYPGRISSSDGMPLIPYSQRNEMRLLRREDDGSFSLTEFIGQDTPGYAILSHTWGVDIQERLRLALSHELLDLANVSIDIAVDKSSSAELTESINSMYQWYEADRVCFVLLEDLLSGQPLEVHLTSCRWFSRRWTLQELIALPLVKFFNQSMQFFGTKCDHVILISAITKIPPCILLEGVEEESICVAAKMSWAAGRQTKRKEDSAYCLLGFFNVHMLLIYGEGDQAFQRLQEGIVKRHNDITIFAWNRPPSLHYNRQYIGLFATSPAEFANSFAIRPFTDIFIEFSTTNKGALFTSEIRLRIRLIRQPQNRGFYVVYLFCLGIDSQYGGGERQRHAGIYLRKLGPRSYCRLGNTEIASIPWKNTRRLSTLDMTATHILIDPMVAMTNVPFLYRMSSVHVPWRGPIQVDGAYPTTLWDHTDSLYMSARFYGWNLRPVVLVLFIRVCNVSLVLLCDGTVLKAFQPLKRPHETAIVFQEKYREDAASWQDLFLQAPSLATLDDTVYIDQRSTSMRIRFTLESKYIRALYRRVTAKSLTFSIVHVPTGLDKPLSQSRLETERLGLGSSPTHNG
ncbi:hypothetical protein IG631_17098 [Alternaria alternata]|nr:hypothetical protein IG631_17098 [Alternaria alternata]